MRLYAYLLLATLALAARAATIPDNAATVVEKKLDPVTQDKDKAPENVASEQELVDITNIINDEDNKLRVKPVEIPVEVVVQKVEPILKSTEESEEIVRPPVDLRNPGPPQRQEHETQNPAFYAAEQQVVQVYKQNLNDAQVVLRQGFQGVNEGFQNLLQNNEQIQMIQSSIQTLRDNFMTQINKLNGTIQAYLNGDSSNNALSPVEQQTKAEFQVVETGLKNLKNDFVNGVQSLADENGVFASLRADNVKQAAPAVPAQNNPVINFFANLQSSMQSNFQNITQSLNNLLGQQTTSHPPPAGVDSDTPVAATPAPSNTWFNIPNPINFITNTQNTQTQGNNPFAQVINTLQNLQQQITNLFQPGGQTPGNANQPLPVKPVEPAPTPAPEKPSVQPTKPDEPIVEEQTKSVTPEKPRDEEVQETVVEPVTDIKKKGHIHFGHDHHHHNGAGDNNDGGERLKASEPVNVMVQELLPEAIVPVQEKKEQAVQKTEEVVDKTE